MMKTVRKTLSLLLLAAAFFLIAGVNAEAQQQSLQEVYNQAVKDFNAQNYDAAEVGFRAILKSKPGYVYARRYLAKVQEAKKNPPVQDNQLEAQLAALTVPKFEFEEVSLGAALNYLSQKSTELSDGKVTANFIYKGAASDRESKLLTLNVANLPLTEVIRYVGLQTGVRFTYEKFAVVGTPVDGKAATAPATPATAVPTKTEEATLKFDR